jgi:CBS domain
MSRRDVHLDAMLRQLGAAYYDSPSGRGARGEVRRAAARLASELGDESAAHGPGTAESPDRVHRHHGRLHCRVRDVMATHVVTVERTMMFKDIARVLVERRISGAPVGVHNGRVVGMVTEGDLLQVRDKHVEARRWWTGTRRYGTDRSRYLRLTAEQLMTSPAVTIYPDATVAAAAEGHEPAPRSEAARG